jgi:hypothetical protein
MGAFYRSTVREFLEAEDNAVLGALGNGAAHHNFTLLQTQQEVWREEIRLLKSTFRAIGPELAGRWHILIEYPLLRLEKRLDVVLLAGNRVVVLEFKVGSQHFDSSGQRQVEDYCLDLRDFHRESAGKTIVPVLCATEAEHATNVGPEDGTVVWPVQCANKRTLADVIVSLVSVGGDNDIQISGESWDGSAYKPVPTIIEAASLLFAGHSVADLARASADVTNLTATTQRLIAIINGARGEGKHVICFVTGVPGSGKTLCGLNAVHDPRFTGRDDRSGTFLSGNYPLVEIVREALIRDGARRMRTNRAAVQRRVHTRIQHIVKFLRQYTDQEPNSPPSEHAIVFDEAQRAWNAEYGRKKLQRDASEAELLLRIMERHRDWAAIIALVGGGQEIHNGEAGLAEWGKALANHTNWEVYVSPEVITGGASVAGSVLFPEGIPAEAKTHQEQTLHLPVSVRSYRSELVATWVNLVLSGEPDRASDVFAGMRDYPVVMTRQIESVREWLKAQTRGQRRCGLVASSGAKRLRAHGVEPHGADNMAEVKHWFLAGDGDVRSSNILEVPTTEFACQGLELDTVGICWGGDLTRTSDGRGWEFRAFKGTKWQRIANSATRDFILNKYRVLLTRAREGMAIWVPVGSSGDATRPPEWFNHTARYLRACGVSTID